MKHSEILEIITRQTGKEPTQQEIGNILGISRSTINSRAFHNLNYRLEEIKKIQEHYGIDLINECNTDEKEIAVDYYPDVFGSCEGGAFEMSQNKKIIHIPKMCIDRYTPFAKYSVINAYGDSMNPTIQNKDRLIVEMLDSFDRIKDNNIYIFFYNDRIFCKRLVQNIDNIVIISDNPDKEIYPASVIEKEKMNDIRLIGRIAGLVRSI